MLWCHHHRVTCHLWLPAGCFHPFVSRLAVKRRSSPSHLSVSHSWWIWTQFTQAAVCRRYHFTFNTEPVREVKWRPSAASQRKLLVFLQSEEQRSWELNVSSGCLCFHLSEESESVWWQQSCVVLCISCGIFTPLVKMQVIVCVCRSCWTRWVPLCSTTGTMICIRTRITVMTCDAFGLC